MTITEFIEQAHTPGTRAYEAICQIPPSQRAASRRDLPFIINGSRAPIVRPAEVALPVRVARAA